MLCTNDVIATLHLHVLVLTGVLIQKFVNYRMRLVVVGDISAWVAESDSLRDFVVEANRGGHIWFVADGDELGRRLASTVD